MALDVSLLMVKFKCLYLYLGSKHRSLSNRFVEPMKWSWMYQEMLCIATENSREIAYKRPSASISKGLQGL